MARNIAQRLLPGVRPKHLLFVLFAVMDKHCIADTCRKRRCGKDITPKDLIAAINMFLSFTADIEVHEDQLEEIAVLCICKNYHYAQPHTFQAPAIARGWISKATKLQEIVEATVLFY